MSNRYVGIDHGTRRIGLAISDPTGSIASPFATIPAPKSVADQARDVIAAAAGFDVDAWVVGHPINMDDTIGRQAKIVEQFAAALAKATSQPVHLWDERLSTATADEFLLDSDFTRKKKKSRRDRLAAQVILQTYLDSLPDPRA